MSRSRAPFGTQCRPQRPIAVLHPDFKRPQVKPPPFLTRTADMRDLPFDDATINLVVSSTAIHNIYHAKGRERAIDEIARVLKPGGQVLIDDIHHLPQYATQLRKAGLEVQLTHGTASRIWRVVSLGQLARGTLIGHKAPQVT